MPQKIALVIDDDPGIVAVIKDLLKERLQYLVLEATDPQRAVDLSRSYAYDLLVLDLHMPKLDGFQVLEEVRKKQPHIKVIVVTGFYERYQERYQHARLDKIIEKPLDEAFFTRSVLSACGSAVNAQPPEMGCLTRAKILIVDDEPEICEALKDWLLEDSMSDYDVEIAGDGQQGLIMNEQFKPDILFFDIKMPHMSGLEMVSAIQSRAGHQPKVYVALSADGYQAIVEDIESRGFILFTKPFRIESVLEILRTKCLEHGLTRVKV